MEAYIDESSLSRDNFSTFDAIVAPESEIAETIFRCTLPAVRLQRVAGNNPLFGFASSRGMWIMEWYFTVSGMSMDLQYSLCDKQSHTSSMLLTTWGADWSEFVEDAVIDSFPRP